MPDYPKKGEEFNEPREELKELVRILGQDGAKRYCQLVEKARQGESIGVHHLTGEEYDELHEFERRLKH